MQDIVPELYEKIKNTFSSKVEKDSYISEFLRMVQKNSATFPDAQKYAKRLGELLGETLLEELKENVLPDGKLYWNIADRTIRPMLNQNYDLVNKAAAEVQKILDKKDGIGLNAVKAARPDERIKGLLDNATVDGLEFSEVQRRMTTPVQNITESFFDDFVYENAAFRYEAGMNPQIVRVLVGKSPCKWCKSLAGVYDYDDVRDTGNPVFQRHTDCHCQIYFKNNKGRYLQGVHSKRMVRDPAAINARALLNLDVTKKG